MLGTSTTFPGIPHLFLRLEACYTEKIVFWYVRSYMLVERCQRFGGTCYPYHLGLLPFYIASHPI